MPTNAQRKRIARQQQPSRPSAESWPTVEEQILRAMQREAVNSAELARRAGVPAAGICRDLKGGLSTAKLGRLAEIASAVGHDVLVCIVPREEKARKSVVTRLLRSLRDGTK